MTAAIVPTDFLAPERLWLLVIVALLGAGYLAVLRWRQAAQVRFTQIDLLDDIAPRRPRWRRHVIAAIQLVGLALGVMAIARPVERTSERTETEGRILVLFDVSLSMMATDVEPDRFEAAKQAAREFVDNVDETVEVGLVSFSGIVDVAVQPTLNRSLLDQGIDNLELAESTAIGDALTTGSRVLTRLADGSPDRDPSIPPGVLVLLTDGETTVGLPTEVGTQAAVDAGVPVFTIAFGTQQGEIPDPVTREIIPVPVRPDELRDVAEQTGGVAYEAATDEELANAYEEIRNQLGETLGDAIEIVAEQTWKWTLASIAVLALAWSLGLWWLRGLV